MSISHGDKDGDTLFRVGRDFNVTDPLQEKAQEILRSENILRDATVERLAPFIAAALREAVEAEREACAVLVQNTTNELHGFTAARIRARGGKQ